MATSLGSLFTTIGKFSGGDAIGLTSWLRKFDGVCVVANKVDDAVKGQLLMLFLEGRAKAVAEEAEEAADGVAQGYDALVVVLKANFDTDATRVVNMIAFEQRVQKPTESEEEFMVELLKLYKNANLGHDAATRNLAVKRKFLQGITPELRRNTFVFCSDPYDAAVTREKIIEHCRAAKAWFSTEVRRQGGDKSEVVPPPSF